jgi:hypothetical protein
MTESFIPKNIDGVITDSASEQSSNENLKIPFSELNLEQLHQEVNATLRDSFRFHSRVIEYEITPGNFVTTLFPFPAYLNTILLYDRVSLENFQLALVDLLQLCPEKITIKKEGEIAIVMSQDTIICNYNMNSGKIKTERSHLLFGRGVGGFELRKFLLVLHNHCEIEQN